MRTLSCNPAQPPIGWETGVDQQIVSTLRGVLFAGAGGADPSIFSCPGVQPSPFSTLSLRIPVLLPVRRPSPESVQQAPLPGPGHYHQQLATRQLPSGRRYARSQPILQLLLLSSQPTGGAYWPAGLHLRVWRCPPPLHPMLHRVGARPTLHNPPPCPRRPHWLTGSGGHTRKPVPTPT